MSVFTWPVRVYWEDTDGGGIVYYASYLRFLERARTEWLRSLGHSQQELASDPGIAFVVASLTIDYRRPARLDDELSVTCEPTMEGSVALRFAQRVLRGEGELVTDASVRVVCVDLRSARPRRLPDFILSALRAEPLLNV